MMQMLKDPIHTTFGGLMTYSKIKIVHIVLWSAIFQITVSSCSYEQLPALSSTVTYGSRLLPNDVEEEDDTHPLTEDPYSN